jgi:hypothetical protein
LAPNKGYIIQFFKNISILMTWTSHTLDDVLAHKCLPQNKN